MGFFFLLAGYFTPASLERKGYARFLGDRFLRLGIPLLAFIFILGPLTAAIVAFHEGKGFWRVFPYLWNHTIIINGPLWFAQALLDVLPWLLRMARCIRHATQPIRAHTIASSLLRALAAQRDHRRRRQSRDPAIRSGRARMSSVFNSAISRRTFFSSPSVLQHGATIGSASSHGRMRVHGYSRSSPHGHSCPSASLSRCAYSGPARRTSAAA